MISPAPVSARKISPFGATVSQRGTLKSFAKTLTWNPGGTVGTNPAGGFVLPGPFPADLVAKGCGRVGFCRCGTSARQMEGSEKVTANTRILRARMNIASQESTGPLALYDA